MFFIFPNDIWKCGNFEVFRKCIFLSKVPVCVRMFGITENNHGSKNFHGVEGRCVYETQKKLDHICNRLPV